MRIALVSSLLLALSAQAQVAIVNSDSGATDPGLTPGAGSNRMCYIGIGTGMLDNSNGNFAATALTYGGQSATLIDTVKPVSPFRKGVSIAVFRLNESGIQAMSGNTITPTWGDTDGEPSGKMFLVVCLSGVDQSAPNTEPDSYTHDTVQTSWSPGTINGVADGYVLAFTAYGDDPLAFDVLDSIESVTIDSATDLESDAAGVATEDTSAVSLAVTHSSSRPAVMSAMVVLPVSAASGRKIGPLCGLLCR